MEHVYSIKGMHCAGCAQTVRRVLENHGATDVHVDFGSETARFSAEGADAVPSLIAEARSAGYELAPVAEKIETPTGLSSVEWRCLISALFTLPFLLHMVVPLPFLHSPLAQLLLSLPVATIGFVYFGRSAFRSLRVGIPNMDVLILLGTGAAFIYSLVGLILELGPDYIFFETTATIITFVLFGNVLEHRAVRSTRSALDELAKLQRMETRRVRSDGSLETVDSRELRVGDSVRVSNGERIPADAEIVEGALSVDESIVTGESAPHHRSGQEKVVGGTLVVDGGGLLRVTAIGEGSVLAHMMALVASAQQNRPPLQRIADRVSSVFVPLVVVIAGAAFLINEFIVTAGFQASLLRSIAVLVIACPCALGLATPTAVMVGLGRAARRGLLFRTGEALEMTQRIRSIVFDKTGTLTTGKFEVDVLPLGGATREEILPWLVALEQASTHPIAHSIIAAFPHIQPARLLNVQEERGRGLRGLSPDGRTFVVGSERFVNDAVQPSASDRIFLSCNDKLLAEIHIKDELRPEAAAVVAHLRQQGLHTALLSGDTKAKVDAIARTLNIDETHAECLPEDKLRQLDALEARGPVAFVGDGINDAPALARASLGIALGDATQVALQSAHIVLLRGSLHGILEAFAIARLIVSTIHQNLFWAFAYNIIAIPLAAAGYLTPMVAALTMAFSDVVVILNSLRLRFRRIDGDWNGA